jgi:hypothetical protein
MHERASRHQRGSGGRSCPGSVPVAPRTCSRRPRRFDAARTSGSPPRRLAVGTTLRPELPVEVLEEPRRRSSFRSSLRRWRSSRAPRPVRAPRGRQTRRSPGRWGMRAGAPEMWLGLSTSSSRCSSSCSSRCSSCSTSCSSRCSTSFPPGILGSGARCVLADGHIEPRAPSPALQGPFKPVGGWSRAKLAGEVQSRSASQQVVHWARIGREVEASASISPKEIAAVLAGSRSYDALNAKEKAVVRAEWSTRMDTLRDALNLAEQFGAAGRTWVELDDDGKVVERGDDTAHGVAAKRGKSGAGAAKRAKRAPASGRRTGSRSAG